MLKIFIFYVESKFTDSSIEKYIIFYATLKSTQKWFRKEKNVFIVHYIKPVLELWI